MANEINWQAQSFSPIKFDPTAGYASAADVFKNLNAASTAKKEAESLAAFRQSTLDLGDRKQDYIEGEEGRLLTRASKERERLSGEAKIFQEARDLQSQSRIDRVNSPETHNELMKFYPYSKLDKEGQANFRNDFASNVTGAAGGLDPVKSSAGYRKHLVDNGLSPSQVDTGVKTYTEDQQLFSSMPADLQKTLITALSKGDSTGPTFNFNADGSIAGRSGATGTYKYDRPQLSTEGMKSIGSDIAAGHGISSKTPGWIERAQRNTIFDMEPSESDINTGISAINRMGITDQNAVRQTMEYAFDTDGKTIKPSFDWRTEEGKTNLWNYAKGIEEASTQKSNTKTGQPYGAANTSSSIFAEGAARRVALDDVIDRGRARNQTNDELARNMLRRAYGDNPRSFDLTPTGENPFPRPEGRVASAGAPAQRSSPSEIMASLEGTSTIPKNVLAPSAVNVVPGQDPILQNMGQPAQTPAAAIPPQVSPNDNINNMSIFGTASALNKKLGKGIMDSGTWLLDNTIRAMPQFETEKEQQNFINKLKTKAKEHPDKLSAMEKIWAEKLGL